MKLKDLELLWKSFLHSKNSRNCGNIGCWWDETDKISLDAMVRHLSSPDTEERRIIRNILKENRISSVLDAGCGVGTELAGYENNGIGVKYTGMDASEKMLEIARKRHPDNCFVEGSVEDLQFGNNSFEAVILKHILEHLPGYQPAVCEAARVASKIVVIDFFHKLLPFDYCRKHKDGFWENWYSKRKFERFIDSLQISAYEKITTIGTSKQTAEIYVLHK